MDRLWTPWRYSYISKTRGDGRPGVPEELAAWPGEDRDCVFCNLQGSVQWALAEGWEAERAERAGLIVARLRSCFLCLNRYPYASGHVLVVPYRHLPSLAKLPTDEAEEMMRVAQTVESLLRDLYKPDGINLGMNLGEAAGAGVANHLHLHALPRWVGDTNFMTVVGETRILPEMLEATWERMRRSWELRNGTEGG